KLICFFFQAEDGIRDRNVTGVQTCALPISGKGHSIVSNGIAECRYEDVETMLWPFPVKKIWGIGSRMERNLYRMGITTLGQIARSEERRVGKERRSTQTREDESRTRGAEKG